MLAELTLQLTRGQSLTEDQVRTAAAALVLETLDAAVKADFLTSLAVKGETPEEIGAFAQALRAFSLVPPVPDSIRARHLLDVVGTGGDQLNTFNISTAAALLCAAAGVTVAKHGNRAVTSACGSADVLEALGIPVDQPPEAAARSLTEQGFAFFFAPRYHPAFRHVAAARKLCAERGQRTIFNFLGPLLNPARPSAMLVGVPRPELCAPLARVLQSLGVARAMVVCGCVPTPAGPAWLDEFSILGPTRVAEFYQENGFAEAEFQPAALPLQPATLADLVGGDRAANAEIVRRLLRGEERGPQRDAVLLNAGAALFVAGVARSVAEGWGLAEAVITSGQAAAKLAALAR
jgi:anthranilate phosphoribosyltransferase